MIAAIVPFAIGDLIVARQLGVAALIVIVLDALIIRPVLLPAAIAVLGPRSWWPTSGARAAVGQDTTTGSRAWQPQP